MRIAVIGTGYVGLVSGVCYAELGHQVVAVDLDERKIATLRQGEVPIHEPGLQEIMQRGMAEGRLRFTTQLAEAVEEAELVVIAVGTPPLPSGEANLAYIEQAAREIALALRGYTIVATKSTVPVGTNERIAELIGELTEHPFDVVSVPEFLREGSAVQDTFHPDRIVIGTSRERPVAQLLELHRPLTESIFVTDIRSAEMIKYASNAFLATKISFINEIANICEKVGADVTKVAHGMGYDRRIGPAFLKAGIGYGGSCFPKDTQALIQIAGNVDYEFKLLKSVVEVNKDQRLNIIRKLESAIGELSGRVVALWGLAFKPDTDDMRDAPALDIIAELRQKGAVIRAYDPIAMSNAMHIVKDTAIVWCDEAMQAVEGADALCLLTEWREFAACDWPAMRALMRQPVLIDGRNLYSAAEMAAAGFVYRSVGRSDPDGQLAGADLSARQLTR
ncbi:nucleotide sugar dehydrogenase [Paenibacillus sp. 598K]|uniref:UDP-glucose dehydrogenase family protein n=1 Tax=Paenibacillus sp. 598K TaxID=1117987 RepID=UPI000FF9277B|nr:UDP-glucose/GDP-mannose dehydrogenase family protein [Paenibacillus sp. 598K]GBF75993.1 nucleotide sugar dehydrogenase [Paenibacillus sp. 598K]